jgi:hypothetical protein
MRRTFWVAALLISVAGCTVNVKQVRIDASTLDAPVPKAIVSTRCAYRLLSIVDERPSGDMAGALGANLITLENAPALIRERLLKSGIADAQGEGRDVEIRLMRLYMMENLYTRFPIVVYQAKIDGSDPFVVRSQLGEMSWSTDPARAHEGYARALQDANARLISVLNEHCR